MGLGYLRNFLRGAVPTMRALDETGWLLEFVTGGFGGSQSGPHLRQWHAPTQVWRRSGVLREHVMAGHSGWYMELRSYGSRAFRGWARPPLSCVEGPSEGARGFTPSSLTQTSSEESRGATAVHGCDGWTVRDPHQRSRWGISAQKGRPASSWSWQPPSADVKAPRRGGMR